MEPTSFGVSIAHPDVSENLFSRSQQLDVRLGRLTGGVFSVHQAIYDLRREKGSSARRNQALRKSFNKAGKLSAVAIKQLKPYGKLTAPP